MRIGQGYDIHRLVEGRPLRLGGLAIESPVGLLGHSDGDVVLHAIGDALLGAIGAGDIGELFPDTDMRWRGADSAELLREIVRRVAAAGYSIVNVDLTIHAERPKMAAHKAVMRERIALLLGVFPGAINLKAKTNEGLDAIGRGEAIAASVVVLLFNDQVTE